MHRKAPANTPDIGGINPNQSVRMGGRIGCSRGSEGRGLHQSGGEGKGNQDEGTYCKKADHKFHGAGTLGKRAQAST